MRRHEALRLHWRCRMARLGSTLGSMSRRTVLALTLLALALHASAQDFRIPRQRAIDLAIASYDQVVGQKRRPIEVVTRQEIGLVGGPIGVRDGDPIRFERWRQSLNGKPLWIVEIHTLESIEPEVFRRGLSSTYYIDGQTGANVSHQRFR